MLTLKNPDGMTFHADLAEVVGFNLFDADAGLIAAMEGLAAVVAGLLVRLPHKDQAAILKPLLEPQGYTLEEPTR